MNIPLKGSGYGMYTTIITLCAHAQQGKAMLSCVCVCPQEKCFKQGCKGVYRRHSQW